MISLELLNAVRAWQAQDVDPVTVLELDELVRAGDSGALASRFSGRLQFGTAGLRGELGAGPMRMNHVTVGQAAIGLGRYLGSSASVVIGYDGRVNSHSFAQLSAELLAGLGLKVYLFSTVVPTPVLAFAIKHLQASAGVMVTASHNPPRDNGYKVYVGPSQIVSPVDADIAACIELVALGENVRQANRSADFEMVDDSVIKAYYESVLALGISGSSSLRIAYTAMHGVGWRFASHLFGALGFSSVSSVLAQQEPNGLFPTVAFPNPEEPGAMDMVLALASKVSADLVIANDPDADRLAVAVRAGSGYRVLSGDDVGLLLGEWAATRSNSGVLANSMVSSEILGRVAAHHGLGFEQTKTGFKWIARVQDLVFGYEEALGYCVDPASVADKDGISAAMVIASIAAGCDLGEYLDSLYLRYGHYATGQVSVRFESVAEARAAFERVAEGVASEMVYWRPDDSSRVIFRVSGTEPKLKCYLQFVGGSAKQAEAGLAQLRAAVTQRLTG